MALIKFLKKSALWVLIPLGVGGSLVIALHPDLRSLFRETFLSSRREILAKAEGDITGRGDWFVVIKIRQNEKIFLEFYRMNKPTEELTLLHRLDLPERRDGYFQFRDQPTNLALVDINNDGQLEVAAPTYDDNLVPRLHIFQYDPEAQIFVSFKGPHP